MVSALVSKEAAVAKKSVQTVTQPGISLGVESLSSQYEAMPGEYKARACWPVFLSDPGLLPVASANSPAAGVP